MYPDRPLQACLHKGWTVYKKNTGRQMALCELFSSCCKGPRGSGVGNAGGQIPSRRGRWRMPEAKSPSDEEGGEWRSLNPPHAAARRESPERGNALQPAFPAQLSWRKFFRERQKNKPPNPIPGRRGLPDLT